MFIQYFIKLQTEVNNYELSRNLSISFREIKPENWFKKSDSLDLLITERYIALHASVVAGEHSSWRNEALGRLAEIIVIDQFSRNIYSRR